MYPRPTGAEMRTKTGLSINEIHTYVCYYVFLFNPINSLDLPYRNNH